MWDASFNGGGGFEENTGSPSKPKDLVKRVQNIVPVVARQILDCSEEEFHLFDMPVQIVSLVGILHNFDVQSTKAICEIEDFSGRIKAVLWLEAEGDGDAAPEVPDVKEGHYVQVFGSVRNQDGEKREKMLMLLKMVPVDDCNVITTHLLQFIHVRLEAEAIAFEDKDPMHIKPSTSKSMSEIKEDDLMSFTGPNAVLQRQLFNALRPVKDCVGLSRDALHKLFPGQIKDVNEVLEFFLSEGYVYSTISNDHFKLTDGFS